MVKQKSSSVHTAHHAQRAGWTAKFLFFFYFYILEKYIKKIRVEGLSGC